MKNISELTAQLNAESKAERLEALRGMKELSGSGGLTVPAPTDYVNNHIHTIYSFSPYSPTKAAYTAWMNGLSTAGIMDHDSIAGAEEFIEAGRIIGLASTIGFECRCSMAGTPFEGRRLNNPDQISVAYMAMHGIPHRHISKIEEFLLPLRQKRNARNRAMVEKLNSLSPFALDFDKDVTPISKCREGGSITERHILFAFSNKLIAEIGRGEAMVAYLENNLNIAVAKGNKEKLLETENDMYEYYLLGTLKSGLVERFYIDASDECPHIKDFIKLGEETGAISAYAYLGDVGVSPTSDKKAQEFEDAYIEELVKWLAEAGIRAVTYMPSRNTVPQLLKLMELCDKNGLFQISGEDINTPFQSFICPALKKPEFKHLIQSTWALIGHERAASLNQAEGMFSPEIISKKPGLSERTEFFAKMGQEYSI